jgi:hypothetical protein
MQAHFSVLSLTNCQEAVLILAIPEPLKDYDPNFLQEKLRRMNTSHILNCLLVVLIICRNNLRNASELFTIAFLLTSRITRVILLFFFVA